MYMISEEGLRDEDCTKRIKKSIKPLKKWKDSIDDMKDEFGIIIPDYIYEKQQSHGQLLGYLKCFPFFQEIFEGKYNNLKDYFSGKKQFKNFEKFVEKKNHNNLFNSTVSKEITFDSAHYLYDYDGKCSNLHGHTYKLKAKIKSGINKKGFVIDFGDLKVELELIKNLVDHALLNEIMPLNPTVENLAFWIWANIECRDNSKMVVDELEIYETPTCFTNLKRKDILNSRLYLIAKYYEKAVRQNKENDISTEKAEQKEIKCIVSAANIK